MKCVICHSSNIEEKTVEEPIWAGSDVVLVPCRVLVCNDCGERYYSRQAMRRLEDIEDRLRTQKLTVRAVGQVLKPALQSELAPTIREPCADYDAEPSEPSTNTTANNAAVIEPTSEKDQDDPPIPGERDCAVCRGNDGNRT